MLSAERCEQGFLPGPAASQRPPRLVGPEWVAPTSRLRPAPRPGPPAPHPGSLVRGGLLVSMGPTDTYKLPVESGLGPPSPCP